MGWATKHIENLKAGKTVTFRPRGNSMTPRIKSGELCTVSPIKLEKKEQDTLLLLSVGDVVLCKVHGKEYLHLIKAVQGGKRFQIGNNKGKINGWIGINGIFGKLEKVED